MSPLRGLWRFENPNAIKISTLQVLKLSQLRKGCEKVSHSIYPPPALEKGGAGAALYLTTRYTGFCWSRNAPSLRAGRG
jgi:hypothetical protein